MNPITSLEQHLAAAAGQDITPPEPQTRLEKFIKDVADRIDGLTPGGGAVNSVNGKTGTVVLTAEDVGAVDNTFSTEMAGAVLTVTADGSVQPVFRESVNTWEEIRNIVRAGLAQQYFSIGDQLDVNWRKGSTTYVLPFDVVSFDPVIKEGSNTPVPGIWLQSHYAGEGVQFDASEAIYVTDEALPAGTYYFTFGDSWGSNVVANKSYQFTTTKEIPAGGQICVGKNNDYYTWGAPDQSPSNWRVHTFESAAATTPLETNLTLTEGSGGTSLGTLSSSTKYGTIGINNLQRAGYGYNRWSQSAMRQYLNSNKAPGAWWRPQNPFDRAPQAFALDGFMAGFDSDFLAVLGKVKVTTALNTVSDVDIGESEDTYDTFFLPSLEQEYCEPQASGVEGAYWPYWKDRLGISSPQLSGVDYANANHIRYVYNNQTSSQGVRLRSAHLGYSNRTWCISLSGSVGNDNSTLAYRVCPVCVIC